MAEKKWVVRSLVERLAATTGRSGHSLPGSPEGEAFLARLLRNFPGMVYRRGCDVAWTLEFASPGARALTGVPPSDLVGGRRVGYRDLVHPEDRSRLAEAVRQAALSGTTFGVEYRIRGVDGRERRVSDHGYALLGAAGEVEAVEGCVFDVTEKKSSTIGPRVARASSVLSSSSRSPASTSSARDASSMRIRAWPRSSATRWRNCSRFRRSRK